MNYNNYIILFFMKNKNKNKLLIRITQLIVVAVFLFAFSDVTMAAEVESACIASGQGVWNSSTGKCACVVAGKVPNGYGYCADPILNNAYENDGSGSGAAATMPGAGEASQGQNLFNKNGSTVSTPQPLPSTKQFEYKLLEAFPGFFDKGQVMTDFPGMILAIYKFGIWTVGIAGFFMLVVGGFMYMASAGNTSSAGSAKGIVIDALIGIAAALGAYLFLYVINPDLTKMNISFTTVDVTETEGTPMGTAGVCQALSSGDCSVASLTGAFGQKATEASSICNGESGGKSIPSSVDICADGNPASWGLFQINITAHSIGGYDCKKAFSGGAYTAKNHNCRVIDKPLYDNCVAAAKNTASNIAAAKSIYNNTSWKPWGANKRSNCNFK
jgi:hypothetical protein